MRKYYFVIGFVMGMIAYHVPDLLKISETSQNPFHAYVDGHPVHWDPGRTMCLKIEQVASSKKQEDLIRRSLKDFSRLTGIAHSLKCPRYNILVIIDKRENLNYLSTSRAIGATTYSQRTSRSREIDCGQIQLDSDFISGSSPKLIELLILHELGHVVGLAHQNDGGIMEEIVDEEHALRFNSNAIEEFQPA